MERRHQDGRDQDQLEFDRHKAAEPFCITPANFENCAPLLERVGTRTPERNHCQAEPKQLWAQERCQIHPSARGIRLIATTWVAAKRQRNHDRSGEVHDEANCTEVDHFFARALKDLPSRYEQSRSVTDKYPLCWSSPPQPSEFGNLVGFVSKSRC